MRELIGSGNGELIGGWEEIGRSRDDEVLLLFTLSLHETRINSINGYKPLIPLEPTGGIEPPTY